MKFFKILLTGILALFLLSGVVMAESSLPISGKIVGSIEVKNLDRELEVRKFNNDYVVIAVPIIKDGNDFWRGYASVCWTDGSSWEIIPMGSYERETAIMDNYMIVHINLPKGLGWYWIRIWGKNSNTQDWLIVNQKSKYHRADGEKKPGYEILVNTATRKEQSVPKNYDTRK